MILIISAKNHEKNVKITESIIAKHAYVLFVEFGRQAIKA